MSKNAFAVLMGAALRRGPAPPRSEPRSHTGPKSGGCSSGTQLHIDLGQRDFGVATCAVCGMLYGKGLPAEERLHDQFHNAHAAAFKFPGWVSERVVLRDGARGRLLCVICGDPKPQQRKVGDVCSRLETTLGLPQGYLLAPNPPYKVFLWVSGRGSGGGGGTGAGAKARITGVLVAQLQECARWEQLTPSAAPGRRSQAAQRDRSGDSSGRAQRQACMMAATATATAAKATPAAAATVTAASAAPITPAAAAVATVEADVDADADGGDGDDGGRGDGGVGRLLSTRWDVRPAAGAAAAGNVDRSSASYGMTFVRDTGLVHGVGGEPAAKRQRLHEATKVTRGSPVASSGESDPAGPAASADAAAAPSATAADASALKEPDPVAAQHKPTTAAVSSGPAALTSAANAWSAAAAPPPVTPALTRPLPRPPPLRHAPGDGGGACCSGGAPGGGHGDGARARVVIGVRGLWVAPGWRRKGVATRLMDAARCCMVPGVAADRTGVAFSACAAAAASGDDDGGAAFAAFAASYLGSNGSGAPVAAAVSYGGGNSTGGGGGGDGRFARVLLYDNDDEEDKEDDTARG